MLISVDILICVCTALAAAALFLLLCNPVFILKTIGRVLCLFPLRLRVYGAENLPDSGPVLLVSNHVSVLDIILLQLVSKRRIRFMMREELFRIAPLRLLFAMLGILKVPGARHPKAMMQCFNKIRERLRAGETVCFFPEGEISTNGSLMRFRSGINMLIPESTEVTILPVHLGMFNGRMFAVHNRRLHLRMPMRWPLDHTVTIGKPLSAELTAFELRQKISELGAATESLSRPGELPIHTGFILRAAKHPWQTTFIEGATGRKLRNFGALVRLILLSRVIRRCDNSTSPYTGVLLPNAPESAILTLAVLAADRTPAMINYSAGENIAIASARDAGIGKILTSRKFLQKLKWQETPEMLCLEDLIPSLPAREKMIALLMAALLPGRTIVRNLAPASCYNMHRQAVLLFSSGSTGKPKAVMLTQLNISCNIHSFIRVIDWSKRKDKLLGNLPFFHAYGFMLSLAFPALFGCQAAHTLNPLDGAVVVKAVKDLSLTILAATPTFLRKYMSRATAEDFKSLRLVITGAEKLRPDLAEEFRTLTGRDIIEGYGCTELSPIVTINLNRSIYQLGKHAEHPGSIGCPLPGIHVRITDPETGVELPPGREGRMQVMAGSVMKGYLNNPAQTALVIQNGYYDTGDIARFDEDGYVYITGRASRFSKIGGEMVPHERIEQAISALCAEGEVAVSGRSDKLKGERLVVFYTWSELDIKAVIENLRNSGLPNIWLPKADDFVLVEAIPCLGSGKLDLLKLKEMAEKITMQ